MPSYLVTGAGRGLGLAFVSQLLTNPENIVIATARETATSKGLQALQDQYPPARLHLVDLDVSKHESIRAAAARVTTLLPNGQGLDHLISNAGVISNGLKTFEELDVDDLITDLTFTVTAPLILMREFLPLVRAGEAKRIAIITSVLGSIENAKNLPNLANGYSVARAALNMLARKWSPVLKSDGITIALLHPGWVNSTGVGSAITEWMENFSPDSQSLTTETSAANCMKVLHSLTIEDAGAFFNHDGTKIPF